MRSFLTVASCCVAFNWTHAWSAEPPLPFVAVRVDYFRGDPEPAVGGSTSRIGEQRGSGVIIENESTSMAFVLTNAHVVHVGQEIARSEPRVSINGSWRRGRVVAKNDESDLALIRVRRSAEIHGIDVGAAPPPDRADVVTHGLSSGKTYCLRKTELHHALPLPSGAKAWAPQRSYVRTTFLPGESGGAVTLDEHLVGLIHGNDPAAGWGLVVDHAAIVQFLATQTTLKQTASAP